MRPTQDFAKKGMKEDSAPNAKEKRKPSCRLVGHAVILVGFSQTQRQKRR